MCRSPQSLVKWYSVGGVWDERNLQCRHLIHALHAWAADALYTTVSPIATHFSGHGFMDDLTTKRIWFARYVGHWCTWLVLFLTWVFSQPGTGTGFEESVTRPWIIIDSQSTVKYWSVTISGTTSDVTLNSGDNGSMLRRSPCWARHIKIGDSRDIHIV